MMHQTPMTVEPVIRLASTRKTFGAKVAVEGIDLRIERGELCGFIGPNGAGKTTTIRMIMGILFPDRGEVEVLGRRNAAESRDRVGYLPEERGVYRKMKVGQFLVYMGKLKGLRERDVRSVVGGWLERVELPGVVNKKCEELSKGMQQKVQFIAAVMHKPDLLILDEPFSGLDPVNMRLLRDLIDEQRAAGRTVVFSTHVMGQAEQVCDRIVMIHQGKKVIDDTVSSIRARHRPTSVLVEPLEPRGDTSALDSLPGAAWVRREGGVAEVGIATGTTGQALMASVLGAVPAARVELKRPTLEDVFISIVRRGDMTEETERLLRHDLRTTYTSE